MSSLPLSHLEQQTHQSKACRAPQVCVLGKDPNRIYSKANREQKEAHGIYHSAPCDVCTLLTFNGAPVDVLVLWLMQGRVFVEQVGDEGQVELGVATDNVGGGDELAAAEALGLLQHALGSLHVILLLPAHTGHQTAATHTHTLGSPGDLPAKAPP